MEIKLEHVLFKYQILSESDGASKLSTYREDCTYYRGIRIIANISCLNGFVDIHYEF